jgi:PhzF family phenazine biosynthesis protein
MMIEIACFQVDAFSPRPFSGNPAAVCPLDAWLPDPIMQSIAAENALSETAFFVPRAGGDFDLRWFTPAVEVDLCGHATLASALVLFERLEPSRAAVTFHTRSGPLRVEREGGLLAMDLPAWPPRQLAAGDEVERALGCRPLDVLLGRDLVVVVETAEQVRLLAPDMALIAALDAFAVCVTAPGGGQDADVDFVSRFFAPAKGVPEDPVTGSAHCQLVPYWAARLGQSRLRARQVSRRGGELEGELCGDRVRLRAAACLVKTGAFLLPDAGG